MHLRRQRLLVRSRVEHAVHHGRGDECQEARRCQHEQRAADRDATEPIPELALSGGLAEGAHVLAQPVRGCGRQRAQLVHELLELTLEVDRVSRGHLSSPRVVSKPGSAGSSTQSR